MKNHLDYFHSSANLSRRALARIAAGGAAAVATLGHIRAANAIANNGLAGVPGVKLAVNWKGDPSDDDLKFLNECGYKYVFSGATNDDLMSVEAMLAFKKRYADAGITLHSIRYMTVGPVGGNVFNDILLDLPGRAKSVENAKTWIRNTAKAGFDYTGGHLMPSGVWSSGQVDVRGGSISRDFDPASPNAKGGAGSTRPPGGGLNQLYFGREYSYDEVMGNFKKYFVGEIVPVLEESGVFIGFHPDDPPIFEKLGGVGRIMNSYAHYKAMFAAANSPNVGMMMCVGTYMEGGDKMGADLLSVLKEFNALKKYREIHFRNISSAPVNGLPRFHETFMDNGYYDMYKIMKTLVDIGFTGLVHQDHTPNVVGAPYAYPAYSAGFMHAALVRAEAEPKGTL